MDMRVEGKAQVTGTSSSHPCQQAYYCSSPAPGSGLVPLWGSLGPGGSSPGEEAAALQQALSHQPPGSCSGTRDVLAPRNSI